MKALCLILLILVYSCNIGQTQKVDSKIEKSSMAPVPNERTAIKIAEKKWLSIYGEKIYSKKPFVATLSENGKVWYVKGTLHTQKGGVPYIEIRKVDGKVLKISHSK